MRLVVVAGALANKAHNGGEAWVRLSYLLGFRRLGLDVAFVEEIERDTVTDAAADFFERTLARFGLAEAAVLVDREGRRLGGADLDLPDLASDAELLVNVSGNLRWKPLLDRFARKAYVDLDPGFTQLWHEDGVDVGLGGHDVYLTVGENVGRSCCSLPTGGVSWRPTRPPLILDEWPVTVSSYDRFTTVASWRGAFGPPQHRGRTFGVKAHQFRRLADLPERAAETFEVALDIAPADAADRALLEGHGWQLVDPREVAGTAEAFRSYVQGSGAEFSVAQGVYVDTRTGWFSDRTVRYLASGKPALVQDTGSPVPAGEGLVTFKTPQEASDGARRIVDDYEAHSRAARALAEEAFDHARVLGRLLEWSVP